LRFPLIALNANYRRRRQSAPFGELNLCDGTMVSNLSWPCAVYIKRIVVAGDLIPRENIEPP
jgi:hypothetical protein